LFNWDNFGLLKILRNFVPIKALFDKEEKNYLFISKVSMKNL
jgi:hypothetical protein